MNYPWIHGYLLAKPGVTADYKQEWNWVRYQLGGKLFAAVCLDDKDKPVYVTMKLLPARGDLLRQQFADIIPGYYCNKVHWNSVKADGCVPDALLKDMLDESYGLILNAFSKKRREEILCAPPQPPVDFGKDGYWNGR